MTTTQHAPPPMRRGVARETRLFAAAASVALAHALDDAVLHRQPGVDVGQHALALAIALGAGVAAIAGCPRLRPGLRSALAFAFGVLAAVNGSLHVAHVAREGVAGGDVTGILAAAAGLVLIGLAAAIPWRHRGTGRWITRALAVPAALVTIAVVAPIGMAIVDTHMFREDVGAPPSPEYRDVSFRSTDGIALSGWYRASHNGAAVVVVHGGGSDRKGAVGHARMLAAHGYGVLLYDARGRGKSEGSPNSYGWGWEKDAAGAVAFLKTRPDVRRVGGLGLSSGADTLVDVAATHPDLDAVVADGTALRTLEDARRLQGGYDAGALVGWINFKAIQVLGGEAPPAPLEDRVARIDSPLLLISAGRSLEYDFNLHYATVAQPSTQHWNLPTAHHTRALREHRAQYEQRVVAFFNHALR